MEKLEQTMQLYHIIYVGCLVITLLLVTITIVLAIRWKIWEAVGILSGKVVTKAVADVGKEKKQRKESTTFNSAQGDATEKLWYREAQSGPPLGGVPVQGGQSTVVLQQEQNATVLLQAEPVNATVLLQPENQNSANGTVVLDANNENFGKTENLLADQNAENGTVVLNADNENFGRTEHLMDEAPIQQNVWQMQILDEIMEIHSQEKM